MLDKTCIEVNDRLKSMFYDALERLSFGLSIVSKEMVFIPQVMTQDGRRLPAFGCYYQARGRLLGSSNYLAQVTAVTDPFITQEGIDEAVAAGCQILREGLAAQSALDNGKLS